MVAAATHHQIGITVLVGVKKNRGHIFKVSEQRKSRLTGQPEAARCLQIQLTRLTGGAANVYVCHAVGIYVGYRCPRPFAAQHGRHVALVIKIYVVIFLVFGKNRCGNHFKQGLHQAFSRRIHRPFCWPNQLMHRIDGRLHQARYGAVGPNQQ